jgi:hypothetical protein
MYVCIYALLFYYNSHRTPRHVISFPQLRYTTMIMTIDNDDDDYDNIIVTVISFLNCIVHNTQHIVVIHSFPYWYSYCTPTSTYQKQKKTEYLLYIYIYMYCMTVTDSVYTISKNSLFCFNCRHRRLSSCYRSRHHQSRSSASSCYHHHRQRHHRRHHSV